MGVLYITKADVKLKKLGGRLQVESPEETRSIILSELDRIVICSQAQVSTQLIYALLENGVPICYGKHNGEVVGTLTPYSCKTNRIVEQVRLYEDEEAKVSLVRALLKKKLYSEQGILTGYNKSIKSIEIAQNSKQINSLNFVLDRKNTVNELRGIEGIAAKMYFECFSKIIKNQSFSWPGRKKHPVTDPVNSMLSFTYKLIANEISLELKGAGLNCSIGYLHEPDNYRESLVYDFLELFRAGVADKLVLSAVNLGKVAPTDFVINAGTGTCYFTDEGRKKWYKLYEENMCAKNRNSKCSNRERIAQEVREFCRTLDEKKLDKLKNA